MPTQWSSVIVITRVATWSVFKDWSVKSVNGLYFLLMSVFFNMTQTAGSRGSAVKASKVFL